MERDNPTKFWWIALAVLIIFVSAGLRAAVAGDWNTLNIGAGGFLTGMSIASDGTMGIRTDTYGGYIWNPTAIAPNGATGTWQQTNVISTFLPNGNFAGQGLGTAIYEIQIAYNDSNIWYAEQVKNYPVYPTFNTFYYSSNKGATWADVGFPAVTVTSSSGAVIRNSGINSLVAGQAIAFQGSLGKCGPLCSGHYYYVLSTNLTSSTFEVASTPRGSAITPSTSISGTATPGIDNTCSSYNARAMGPFIAVDPNTSPAGTTAYLGTPCGGLWYTDNSGATLTQVSSSEVPTPLSANGTYPGYSGMAIDMSHNLYVASFGRGVYECSSPTNCKQLTSGTGPTYVYFGTVDYKTGHYWAVEGSDCCGPTGNLWVWNGSTWSKTITGCGNNCGPAQNVQAVAADPNNSGHVVAIDGYGNPDETFNSGGSWSGWSTTNSSSNLTSWRSATNDIGWWTAAGAFQPTWMYFDRTIEKIIHVVANGDFWTNTPWSGNIAGGSSGTQVVWNSQGRGIEQLVINEIVVPETNTPIVGGWDFGIHLATIPPAAYPSTSLIWPASNGVVTAWSVAFCPGNPSYVFALADGGYAGGPQGHSYSANYGASWTSFVSDAPESTFGGVISCATKDNVIFAGDGEQAYYTTNFTSLQTWNAVVAPGVFNTDTIASGSYTSSSGAVSLTLSNNIAGGTAGSPFNLSNLTATGAGAGNVGQLDGNVSAATTAAGTAVTYTAATGLGNMTITGGKLTGWDSFNGAYFNNNRAVCADQGTVGNFYLILSPPGGGPDATLYSSTDGGAEWTSGGQVTTALGSNYKLECPPGETADIWFSEGIAGNCCNQGYYASYESGLVHITNATSGSPTVHKLTNINNVYALGFGTIEPGNVCCGGSGYPQILAGGWAVFRSTSSVNIGSVGPQTFNVGSGLTILPDSSAAIQGASGINALGNVISYNSSTGNLIMDITTPGANSLYSSWHISLFGIWGSDDEGTSWQEKGIPTNGTFDGVKTIAGDPTIWGQIYVGFSGSGDQIYLPYLLNRDLDPASNDNSPMWVDQAS
jgi:hypothetical protein